jgi:hypothetical protein
MKKALVSFAVGSHYVDKMKRLEQSLHGNFDGDFLGFTSYEEIGCKTHQEVPFMFKPYAIQKAIDLGYELILWADSQVYAKSNIQPVFDWIQNHYYLIFDNIGFSLGDYTNDRTLNHFEITREQSWKIKMVNAKVFGLHCSHQKAWFGEYCLLAEQLYPGEWTNKFRTESTDMRCNGHRHDQSVLSCLAHKYDMKITKSQDTFFANEEHRKVMSIADSVCLFAG